MKRLFLTILTVFSLVACDSNPSSYYFELKDLGDHADFHTELQAKYNEAEDYTSTLGIASGSTAKDAPLPITLSWDGAASNKKEPVSYKVELYEGRSSRPIISENVGTAKEYNVYNLKINTSYKYKVTAVYGAKKSFTSDASTFIISDKGPRNLYVENVMNIRDLGGHGIKQGYIFRSGRLNEDDGTTTITENTIKVMTKELGIRTEIDLRRGDENGGINVSPLGTNVKYIHLPMYYGGENILTYQGTKNNVEYDNPTQILNFFNMLAKQENYPIDFHCAIGKDRTGCMAYLIGALCGVEEEYLYRDYLYSNFAKISGTCEVKDIDDRYGATIKEYEGANLQDKTMKYLNEVIGVSRDNLNAIRNLLSER